MNLFMFWFGSCCSVFLLEAATDRDWREGAKLCFHAGVLLFVLYFIWPLVLL